MRRHLELVPVPTAAERAAARRLAAFEDWWDAQWALTRARGAGTSTIDDVTAVRVAALSLKLAQQEQS